MSTLLWKSFFENDVDHFRQVLARATYNASTHSTRSGKTSGLSSSPGPHLAITSTLTHKSRKQTESNTAGGSPQNAIPKTLVNITLSRADLNWRDANGVTLLHQIASSTNENAPEFALALLEQKALDLYVQDEESGWTALHRALYFGNITIARALMDRDINDAMTHSTPGAAHTAGGLIKIKDREGNSPFDVYGASITNRLIRQATNNALMGGLPDDEDEMAQGVSGDAERDDAASRAVAPRIQVNGDEIFAFGSNKNFTLGFGDEDDRQFPERVYLKRPEHLLRRFLHEHEVCSEASNLFQFSGGPTSPLSVEKMPALVQYRPIIVQDVQLSKLHSAILTTDPEANLYICGFGSGGRLGTGDETTRFGFVNIHGGGLIGKKIIAVGLGQDHTVAISSEGETFTWGSNASGQLGYASNTGPSSSRDEKPMQLLPRQVFGPLKREVVVGAAASRIHSVVYTAVSLYTFGKNEGQLGLVDSDARSRATQDTPRKVAASLFSSAINSVSAIERATTCLLENHEVWVFANFGYMKVSFPLDGFSNYFLQTISGSVKPRLPTGKVRGNEISKVISGGDTICAMSTMGDVFTVHVSQKSDSAPGSASTTNPTKIRGALSPPQRVWSLKKGHMAVRDVDVGQDGSVIICTEAGSVWRRVKRAKIKVDAAAARPSEYKAKDYKFSRVPRLTRITAVRSNAFGGFAALRRDCDVLKTQVNVEVNTLWKDMYPLLPFHCFGEEDSDTEEPTPRFWTSSQPNDVATIRRAVLSSSDLEETISDLLMHHGSPKQLAYDLNLGTTTTDVRIPLHEFVLAGRSEVMQSALTNFRQHYFFSIPEVLTIEYDKEGKMLVLFQGLDFITILNLVLYLYTDCLVDVWHHTKHKPQLAFRYRQIRTELMKVSSQLEMRKLEQAVRVMSEPPKTLHEDFRQAISSPSFFNSGDVEVELDGSRMKVHSALMCQRCPFFEGLFEGRAGGRWLSSRREQMQELQEAVRVDLKHVDPRIFEFVLQHLYADTDERMFDDVITTDFDAFLDLILEVMSVANELMLDRLSQCCQKMLGRYVNTRNVCQLLNVVAPCSVTEFKDAALEYICLNLEGMLENHLLGELDEDLMLELDEVVRQNQLNCLPISKSGRAEAELIENYPELIERMERSKRIQIDAVSLHSRLYERESRIGSAAKAKADLLEDFAPSPSMQKDQRRRSSKDQGSTPKSPSFSAGKSPVLAASRSPVLSARKSTADLMFSMDDSDEGEAAFQTPKRRHRPATDSPRLLPSGLGLDEDEFPTVGLSQSPSAGAALATSAKSPPSHKASHGFATGQRQSASGEFGVKPWASSSFSAARLDLKDIMAQTPSGRVSSISSGLSSPSQSKDASSGSLPTRLSQKERKRQQQQQLSQTAVAVTPPSADLTVGQGGQKPPSSPWQMASRRPKVNLKDVIDTAGNTAGQSKVVAARTPSPMTLRQTVSGKPPHTQGNLSGPAASSLPPAPSQTASSSTRQSSSSRSVIASAPNPADFPAIQSIRHTSGPVEPTLQLSMADIVAQQNREKELIKEAVAKRSLQEIQEEQAFQEWWDLESRKAREEEEAARKPAAPSRGGKSGRGRSRIGKGARAGGTTGKKKEDGGGGGESSATKQKDNNTGKMVDRGRGRSQ